MSRGGSYGGGQSSLGYLFGSDTDEPPRVPTVSPLTIHHHQLPPYGTDITPPPTHYNSQNRPESDKQTSVGPNNYQRTQGQNTGNFITDRPSTKVRSVPGGDSSLGYLFGDK